MALDVDSIGYRIFLEIKKIHRGYIRTNLYQYFLYKFVQIYVICIPFVSNIGILLASKTCSYFYNKNFTRHTFLECEDLLVLASLILLIFTFVFAFFGVCLTFDTLNNDFPKM